LHEGNVKENIFNFPWLKDRSISLGMLIKLGLFLLQAYKHTSIQSHIHESSVPDFI
jgi:hypothetical protein